MLTKMDGVQTVEVVLVFGGTNRFDMMHDGLLRQGRFDDVLKVSLPDLTTRLSTLVHFCADMPITAALDFDGLAGRTEGCSGADLKSLCAYATFAAMRELHGVTKDEIDTLAWMRNFRVRCFY